MGKIQYHGLEIELPKDVDWTKIKWVETVEGCFTLQVNTDSTPELFEEERKFLCELARKFLEFKTGEKVEKYVQK